MKLARKLTAALILTILTVMGGYAYFQTRQEIVMSRADLQRARRLALAWIGVIESVWRREGPERAQELAERAVKRSKEIRMRLIPLDPAGDLAELHPSSDERRTLRSGRAIRRAYTDPEGAEWVQFHVLLSVPGPRSAAVEYREPASPRQTFIQMSRLGLIVATLAVTALCGLVVSILEWWLVGRPLQLLRDKANRCGAGDFSGPLHLRQRDEIGELAAEINAMCAQIADANRQLAEESEGRLAALEQLRHTDRLATIGQIAASIAHELGTPLNVASARAELIAGTDLPHAEVVQSARTIVEQTDRMADIIRELLDFSRRRSAQRTDTDLRQLVTRTADLIRGIATKARVSITCDVGSTPALVTVAPNAMQQALLNLMMNGIQAMPRGGRLRLAVQLRQEQPPAGVAVATAGYWCVTIEDEGTGIAPEYRARLFEPFFTTKRIGEGTGLGLPVTHDIVTEHGGWIAVDTAPGRGTRFAIMLPPAPAADRATEAA